jgi:hypothetical protein
VTTTYVELAVNLRLSGSHAQRIKLNSPLRFKLRTYVELRERRVFDISASKQALLDLCDLGIVTELWPTSGTGVYAGVARLLYRQLGTTYLRRLSEPLRLRTYVVSDRSVFQMTTYLRRVRDVDCLEKTDFLNAKFPQFFHKFSCDANVIHTDSGFLNPSRTEFL